MMADTCSIVSAKPRYQLHLFFAEKTVVFVALADSLGIRDCDPRYLLMLYYVMCVFILVLDGRGTSAV
jgi:hypothetical protein